MTDPASLFNLTGKVACVTGASGGLGRRAATVLARAGANVVGVARRADALADWQADVGKNAAVVAHDLADRNGIEALAAAVTAAFGAPDILVHAAGINTRQAADDVTPDGWDITMDLNLRAPFFLSQLLKQFWATAWFFPSPLFRKQSRLGGYESAFEFRRVFPK